MTIVTRLSPSLIQTGLNTHNSKIQPEQGAGLEAHLKYQREKEQAVKTGAEEGIWTARETQSSI